MHSAVIVILLVEPVFRCRLVRLARATRRSSDEPPLSRRVPRGRPRKQRRLDPQGREVRGAPRCVVPAALGSSGRRRTDPESAALGREAGVRLWYLPPPAHRCIWSSAGVMSHYCPGAESRDAICARRRVRSAYGLRFVWPLRSHASGILLHARTSPWPSGPSRLLRHGRVLRRSTRGVFPAPEESLLYPFGCRRGRLVAYRQNNVLFRDGGGMPRGPRWEGCLGTAAISKRLPRNGSRRSATVTTPWIPQTEVRSAGRTEHDGKTSPAPGQPRDARSRNDLVRANLVGLGTRYRDDQPSRDHGRARSSRRQLSARRARPPTLPALSARLAVFRRHPIRPRLQHGWMVIRFRRAARPRSISPRLGRCRARISGSSP